MTLQQVHLRINDAATAKPTPVRLRITDAEGTYYAPYGRLTEFATGVNQDVGGNVRIGAKKWAYVDGTCEILLPPGTLHIEISKGPEYKPIDEEIQLLAGKLALRFEIERWSDVRKQGWYSGDTCVHFLSPDAALLEGQSEDVAVVNLLTVDTGLENRDERPPLSALFGAEAVVAWQGKLGILPRTVSNILSFSGPSFARQAEKCGVAVNTQNNHRVLGSLGLLHCHRVVYPLAFGGFDGKEDWTLEDWCDQCHRKKGLVVWSHPYFPFAEDPHSGEVLADLLLGKIDAIELTPRQDSSYPNLEDYHELCQAEIVAPLTGASGKNSNRMAVGTMRTYAYLPPDQPFTYTSWIEAVRAGRTFVSSGPLLQFTINGSVPERSLNLAGDLGLQMRAVAQSWEPFERIELLWNGEPVADASPTSSTPYQAVLDHELTVERSGWLAALCKGKGVLAHSSAVAVHRHDSPGWANAAAVQRWLDDLDATLLWAKEKARCDTPQQRERLCHVFQAARTVLAKKLS